MTTILQEKIRMFPLTSGVYLMKDAAGNVIYIGKAVSLRRRVQSYFDKSGDTYQIQKANLVHVPVPVREHVPARASKTDLLVSHVVDIDHIKTHSEAEALILEASLVRKFQPKYNIDLKDDKSYPYICISDDNFPLVSVQRRSPRSAEPLTGRWFGPYTDSALIREALGLIRKIFPFRSCRQSGDTYQIQKANFVPVRAVPNSKGEFGTCPRAACLYHDIGLCPAPCIGKVTAKEYRRNIDRIVLVLEGEQDKLYRQIRLDMERASAEKDFEEAARLRDQLRAIGSLYLSSPDVNYFKEAEQLERALGLPRKPERIECIDISTTMGESAVGSIVSFFNGKPDKSQYRKFRIKEVKGMDDFKMVAEVVRRRYGRLKRENKPYPDLVIIDGGKGQLSAAFDELKNLGINIPLISLAKRDEEVFVPGKRNPVVLSRDSLALKLLQRARDEAHRFAVAYHRILRGKSIFKPVTT